MKRIYRHYVTKKPSEYFWTSEEFRGRCERFIARMRRRGTFGKESERLDLGPGERPIVTHHTWLEVRGNGMAPRYFDGEAILANLDSTAAIGRGEFGIVAWKRHPEPVLRRTFVEGGRVLLIALNGDAPTVLQEEDVIFFCPIIRSEIRSFGTAMSIRRNRKEAPKRYQKFFRVVESVILA